ncbi:MAG TPA: hypothetical protein ACFYED_10355 [Candidatus Tripitaka californicus]|uniref:hypothetical protein n=1 Tax=Candidatus Tripitaka californicus TaxID=3367616 RepID=UPI004025F340
MEKGPESRSNGAVNHYGPSPNRPYEKVKGPNGRRKREELVVGLCWPEEDVLQVTKTFWALKGAVSEWGGEKRYPGGQLIKSKGLWYLCPKETVADGQGQLYHLRPAVPACNLLHYIPCDFPP